MDINLIGIQEPKGNCDVDSEYASSDESAAPKRVVAKFNRSKTKYKNVLTVEDDFIPE